MRETQNFEYLSPWHQLVPPDDESELPELGVFPPGDEECLSGYDPFKVIDEIESLQGLRPGSLSRALASVPGAMEIIEEEAGMLLGDPAETLVGILELV